MSTLLAFANNLAKYFILSQDKRNASTHIIYEINSRVDDNFRHLDEEDKKIVLGLVEDLISGKLQFSLKHGEMIVRKKSDYDDFLALKKYISDHLHN